MQKDSVVKNKMYEVSFGQGFIKESLAANQSILNNAIMESKIGMYNLGITSSSKLINNVNIYKKQLE
jgi:hypothetical protein